MGTVRSSPQLITGSGPWAHPPAAETGCPVHGQREIFPIGVSGAIKIKSAK